MIVPERTAFFAGVRVHLFNGWLSPPQVAGINAILDGWDKWAPDSDPRWVAYALGTTRHETAGTMQPIAEFGRGRRQMYGVPTGPWHMIYYGRGDVQETWLANYEKADARLHALGVLSVDENMVENPDLALRQDVAAACLIFGMIEGWFTGKKLTNYFNNFTDNWVAARAIVNGTDRAALVASYGLAFYHAMTGGT